PTRPHPQPGRRPRCRSGRPRTGPRRRHLRWPPPGGRHVPRRAPRLGSLTRRRPCLPARRRGTCVGRRAYNRLEPRTGITRRSSMKRREFLKKAGVVAASASISPLMFAKAQGSTQYRWGMPTSWPTGLDMLYGGAVTLSTYVRDMSDGQLEIEPYPAGAQIGGLEVYDAVASGAFEMGHSASYYY